MTLASRRPLIVAVAVCRWCSGARHRWTAGLAETGTGGASGGTGGAFDGGSGGIGWQGRTWAAVAGAAGRRRSVRRLLDVVAFGRALRLSTDLRGAGGGGGSSVRARARARGPRWPRPAFDERYQNTPSGSVFIACLYNQGGDGRLWSGEPLRRLRASGVQGQPWAASQSEGFGPRPHRLQRRPRASAARSRSSARDAGAD